MEDREIVNLYWERNASAIKETASKYGRYCKAIAKNILGNNEDADRWRDIYHTKLGQLKTMTGYTDWDVEA